jgi:demethylmenaquinone methyltransferase/2-methoxy-6-polyprenyl-1,4-benzoquinol methylase
MDSDVGRTSDERSYYALNRRVYGIFAPFYDKLVLPIRHLRDEVAAALPLDRRTRVLDVATGTGAQARAFADRAGEVFGIDLSEAMLRIARRKHARPNVVFRQGDATQLPFRDRYFDAACISFALHEMPPSIRERALREMARVTRPGGAIAIVDYGLPKNETARWFVYHVVKLYEGGTYAEFVRSDLPALLKDAGIDLLDKRSALGGLASIYTGRRHEIRETAATPPQTTSRTNATSRA